MYSFQNHPFSIIHPDILTTNFPIHSSGLTYSQNSLLTNKVPTNKNRDKKINSKTNSPVNKVQNVQYPVYQNLTPLNVNVNHDHDSDISEGHDNRTKNNKESSPTKMTNNQYNTSPKSSSYVPMAALLSASAQIKNIKDNNNPPQRSSNNNDDNQNSQNNIKNNILNKFPQPSSSAANQNLLNNFSKFDAAASISTSGVILPNHFENLTIGENKINEQPNSGKYVNNKSNLYNGSNLNGDSLEYYSHSPLDGEMHQNLRFGVCEMIDNPKIRK